MANQSETLGRKTRGLRLVLLHNCRKGGYVSPVAEKRQTYSERRGRKTRGLRFSISANTLRKRLRQPGYQILKISVFVERKTK